MSSITLNTADVFPDGTTVSAYQRNADIIDGAPSGTAVTTATATSGTVTFAGLADNTGYIAYASVSGQDRFRRFYTGVPPSAGSGGAGQPQVFVQDTQPSASYPYIWVVTDGAGNPTGEIQSNYGGAVGPVDVDAIQSIVNGKGELLAASAADTLTRVPAGADGNVLKANSAVAAGVEWGAAPGINLPYVAGSYYIAPGAGNQSAAAPVLNRLYFFPFVLDTDSQAFDALAINVATAAAAGGTAKLAIYALGTGAAAGALLASGSVATDSTGDKTAAIVKTLTRGAYLLSAAFQGNVTSLTVGRVAYPAGPPIPSPAPGMVSYTYKGGGDSTSGALPDPGGAFSSPAVGTFAGPAVFLRAA